MSVLKKDLTLFENLSDWEYKENFTTVTSEFGELDIHFVDENSTSDECVLLLHGNPTWGYLYRNMIDPLKENGYRVVVPDLPGFGKSDKFSVRYNYSYEGFVDWMSQFIENTDLKNITLFCQDWGGLIGLRLAAKYGDRFEKIVAANTGLPTGKAPLSEGFAVFREFLQIKPDLHVAGQVRNGTTKGIDENALAAYNAPFPDDDHKQGVRQFPNLVPGTPRTPSAEPNKEAWKILREWEKPFLCAFSDKDPIFSGVENSFYKLIPGCKDMPHVTIENAGHFLQEDQPEACVDAILSIKDI
ncbi:haloalkane dehalogenase [Acidimicrobiaceae bacterium]|nr:haloalkane dehalogenase [Acidimicrobiaceae bacterium]